MLINGVDPAQTPITDNTFAPPPAPAPEVVEPVVDPAAPIDPVVAASEPIAPEAAAPSNPTLPGQRGQATPAYSPQEVAALQAYASQAATQLQQYQAQVREMELAGLNEEERFVATTRQQAEDLAQRETALQDWYARNQWHSYYSQWVDDPATIVGSDPVEWQHSVLTHLKEGNTALTQHNAKLTAEVEALRNAQTAQPTAPKVSEPGGAPVPGKSLWDMSFEEMEAFKNAAFMSGEPIAYPAI